MQKSKPRQTTPNSGSDDAQSKKTRKRPKVKAPEEIAVIDFETDPFKFGRVPQPFAAGFFNGVHYKEFWGDDAATQLVAYLHAYPVPLLIYAHNGGKFDFYYLLDSIENPIRIINGRIVECRLGKHTLRDSFAAIPVALKTVDKGDIDYDKMERECRDLHRAEICDYLRRDCKSLYKLVAAFAARFYTATGPCLTVGNAAIRQLRKFHPQPRTADESHDSIFRPFYYGGRVQAFRKGVVRGDFKIYDVNSMYPAVMRNYMHPIGVHYVNAKNPRLNPDGTIAGFKSRIYFIDFSGRSRGHLPARNDKGGIDFSDTTGRFTVCSHEFRAAYVRGLVDVHEIHSVTLPKQMQTFGEFVDTFAAEKISAKKSGDKLSETFAKLILNSAYGKFAQNPHNYRDYFIERLGEVNPPDGDEWTVHETNEFFRLWKKPVDTLTFNDVAVAASITSAARAVLLEAICDAKDPIYCDTDSLICRELGKSTPIDSARLGAWKFEGAGDCVSIGGKKLYSVSMEGTEIKSASKGVRLSALQIQAIAKGESVRYEKMSPAYKLDGDHKFIARNIKAT